MDIKRIGFPVLFVLDGLHAAPIFTLPYYIFVVPPVTKPGELL